MASLKWLQPKNPRLAENGDGCDVTNTRWLGFVISSFFFSACFPQSRNTIGFVCPLSILITLSVNVCHPHLLCELALPLSTVKTVFSKNTPSRAHDSRQPDSGMGYEYSSLISLNIFLSDLGIGLPSGVENARPWAWPGSW